MTCQGWADGGALMGAVCSPGYEDRKCAEVDHFGPLDPGLPIIHIAPTIVGGTALDIADHGE